MIKADAVLLDVDGTLWDSTALVAEAWMQALKEDGIDRKVTPEQLKKLFGKPMDVIADLLLPELGQETRYRALRRCMDREEKVLEENKKDISYPGVTETIRKLAGKIPVCIVSNCQSGYIELVCEKLGITEVITDKECYGDTGLYKADNIKKLVERNGYHAPVYVGDIAGDLEAAREAGVPFIHAAYGFGHVEGADAVIESFAELIGVLGLETALDAYAAVDWFTGVERYTAVDNYAQVKPLTELAETEKGIAQVERELMSLAIAARKCAYAPYSNYQVGAALLTEDGRVYIGGNIENASYGATNCAERTVAFKAVSEGARRFRMIAIAGGSGEKLNYAFPCGICRQVLREFADPERMTVLVGVSPTEYKRFTLEELLPDSFGPDFKKGMD